ncbi:MAG: hypothetical protein O3A63_07070 [Proteobacteria bacterium]|nr:hypothetical protein [Pseudomonadota bacterium]
MKVHAQVFSLKNACIRLWLAASVFFAGYAGAYEAELHQQLTFLAAKQFNRCVADTDIPSLSALQVRYIAKSNVSLSNSSVFARMFRWNYYSPSETENRSILWLMDTRFHDQFNALTEELSAEEESTEQYRLLGRVVGYVQDVTSPAHTVPVYVSRWWRLSLSDRFDQYPVDLASVAESVARSCEQLMAPVESLAWVLQEAALETLTAVQGQINGLPVSWEAFWTISENPGGFGEYGPAGNNFGRSTEFRCANRERCVLLNKDPLYEDFARQRHIAAVLGTMRAMMLVQSLKKPVPAL